MQITPSSNYNRPNINYTGYHLKLAERIPVSINPVKTVTNNILKKTAILSNMYQYAMDNAIKNYITPVLIPHSPKYMPTNGWEIKKGNSQKYVVVLHGLSHNITNLQDLYKGIIENTDYAVLAPEYTDICYPHNNRKTFSDKTILEDSKAIINYLDNKGINRKNIVIAGHSFGGYVAATMAKEFSDIGKLILISPTDSFKHRAEYIKKNGSLLLPNYIRFFLKKFKFPKNQLSHMYETNKLLKKVSCPIDIIYAKNDHLVKQADAEYLASVCPNLHKLHILNSGTHRMDSLKMNEVVSILNG